MRELPTRQELHFGDRVMRCFTQRPTSVGQMLLDAVARNPAGEALVVDDERLTWRELHEKVMRCAAGLAKLGVEKGDRVALLVGNNSEFVILNLAIPALGAIMVPMSTREQTPNLTYIVNHCTPKVLIHGAEFADRVPAAGDIPSVKQRVGIPEAAGCVPFAELMKASPLQAAAAVSEDDAAAILYTSGTTGRPKGAVLTHLGIVHSAMNYEAGFALGPDDRCAAVVPLTHVTGLAAIIMPMVRCAGALIIKDGFKAKDYLALAERERVTYTLMVPAMYNLCLLQPQLKDHDLSRWRVAAYGGAPMPQATIDSLAQKLPNLVLMNVYGATETTSPVTMVPPGETGRRGESVGLPLPCADILIMGDDGREVPRGETGEIWTAGPMIAREYWSDAKATAQGITGGYWHTGDIGRVDAEGYIHVSDRMKDMLNRGGLKIYSVEVENVLQQYPGVVEAAVVGKPCPVLGERVHAFVYAGGAPVDEAKIKALCTQRLSDYKVPESFTFTTEPLPRNPNGKIVKRALREQLVAQMEAAGAAR
ncbi:MAG: long-chain fatty acid--CoA ligase [Betaproteobacteria bacterium]|nr:MAG: long-chain fatty acid--CoA ligase [Betaproteobacteria bacterium]